MRPVFTLIGLVLFGSAAAMAQIGPLEEGEDRIERERRRGWIEASAYRPVPSGGAIYIEAARESPMDLWLHDLFTRGLQERGYRIDPGAPLYLRFSTAMREPEDPAPPVWQAGDLTFRLDVFVARRGEAPSWEAVAATWASYDQRAFVDERFVGAVLDAIGKTVERRSLGEPPR